MKNYNDLNNGGQSYTDIKFPDIIIPISEKDNDKKTMPEKGVAYHITLIFFILWVFSFVVTIKFFVDKFDLSIFGRIMCFIFLFPLVRRFCSWMRDWFFME